MPYFYTASNGRFALVLNSSRGWGDLPRTKSEYCNSPQYFHNIVVDALNRAYDLWGLQVPDNSFVIIYLNDMCRSDLLSDATIGMSKFTLKYGTRRLGASIVFHFSSDAPRAAAVFVRNIGHNLGLMPSGVSDEYPLNNPYDLMSKTMFYVYLDWTVGYVLLPTTMSAYHRWFLGWIDDVSYITLTPGTVFTLSCRDMPYVGHPRLVVAVWNLTRFIAFELVCNIYLSYYVSSGSVYFSGWSNLLIAHAIDTRRYSDGREWVSYYDRLGGVGDRWLGSIIPSRYVMKNMTIERWSYRGRYTEEYRVIGRPNISDVFHFIFRPYGSVVIGERGSLFTLLASNYFVTRIEAPYWRIRSYLDSHVMSSDGTVVYWDRLPGKVVGSVGGAAVNRLTALINPPNRVGYDGIPFYYDTSAGGVRDARTGRVYSGNVFVIAMAYVPAADKCVLVMWGLSARDTYASGVYLQRSWLPYRGVVVEWRDVNGNGLPDFNDSYNILATWP